MARDRDFTKLGANINELEIAWKDRLADAKSLITAGRNATAIALGIYSLEILLKTLICKKLDLSQLPTAFEIHEPDQLLVLAGLNRQMNQSRKKPIKQNWDAIVNASKKINDLRYSPDNKWTKEQVSELLDQLEDPINGVIPWHLMRR